MSESDRGYRNVIEQLLPAPQTPDGPLMASFHPPPQYGRENAPMVSRVVLALALYREESTSTSSLAKPLMDGGKRRSVGGVVLDGAGSLELCEDIPGFEVYHTGFKHKSGERR